jgi:hypothetical protein
MSFSIGLGNQTPKKVYLGKQGEEMKNIHNLQSKLYSAAQKGDQNQFYKLENQLTVAEKACNKEYGITDFR